MRIDLVFIFVMNIYLVANASENPKSNPLQQLQKQADKLLSSKMYFAAIPLYQKLYSKQNDPNNAWNLSECYWNLSYYDSAVVYLKKANIYPKISSERLGEYHLRNGNVQLAKAEWENALTYSDDKDKTYFQKKIQALANKNSLLKDSADWFVNYLSFNTGNREYAPSIFNGELYFISNRDAGFILPQTNSKDGLPYDGVYKAGRLNDLMSVKPVFFQQPAPRYNDRYLVDITPATSNDNNLLERTSRLQISSPSASALPKILKNAAFKGHVGPVHMIKSSQEIYFTRTSRRKINGAFQLEICKSVKNETTWSAPLILSINDYSSSSFHPFFDEENKVLYFASDRAGGQGGADIYRANLTDDGNWTTPMNLGSAFNTIRDESFPSVTNNKLYFASNGWPGLGGVDILKNDIKIPSSMPVNLGFPINSNFDDYSIVFSGINESGYFSTNRYGSDDVLSFNYTPKFITIKGAITNQNTGLRQYGIKVSLEQNDENNNWTELESYTTNHKGVYEFKVRPNQSNYRVRFTVNDLASDEQVQYFDTEGVTASKELANISLNIKDKVNIGESTVQKTSGLVWEKNNESLNISKGSTFRIYHYFNSTGYIQESHKDLQNLIRVMLKNNGVKIKISSAADCFGNAKLNWELSKQRAEYIQSLFPAELNDRITIEWLGNSKPAKICDVKSRTYASEQINRYTLISIN